MDIHVKLWQRKINKKKYELNKVLRTKRKYKKLKEQVQDDTNQYRELIPEKEDVQEDPMLQKKLNFYDEIFKKETAGNESEEARNKKDKKKAVPIGKGTGKPEEHANKNHLGIKKTGGNQISKQNFIPTFKKGAKGAKPIEEPKNLSNAEKKEREKLKIRKTKRGQPVMKDIMFNLLSKVEKSFKK